MVWTQTPTTGDHLQSVTKYRVASGSTGVRVVLYGQDLLYRRIICYNSNDQFLWFLINLYLPSLNLQIGLLIQHSDYENKLLNVETNHDENGRRPVWLHLLDQCPIEETFRTEIQNYTEIPKHKQGCRRENITFTITIVSHVCFEINSLYLFLLHDWTNDTEKLCDQETQQRLPSVKV